MAHIHQNLLKLDELQYGAQAGPKRLVNQQAQKLVVQIEQWVKQWRQIRSKRQDRAH
ncbi:MAG: hypothetical protein IT506_08135 [Aquabacterium sp.]|nr:hypothetical protein [Aquabacterium sp.]